MPTNANRPGPEPPQLTPEDVLAQAERFESEHPEYVEAEQTFELTMEQYQASLNALYRPTIYSSDSADVGAYGHLE